MGESGKTAAFYSFKLPISFKSSLNILLVSDSGHSCNRDKSFLESH